MARYRTIFIGLFMVPYICLYEATNFEMQVIVSNFLW